MNSSVPPMAAPIAMLPVMKYEIIMVSNVPIVLHVTVFTRLLELFECPVPGMCDISVVLFD